MAVHRSVRRLSASAETCFAVAADVGAYSEFLPLLQRSSIRGSKEKLPTGERFAAEFSVAYDKLGLRETAVSQVTTDRVARTVQATSKDGPFQALTARWSFADVQGGCDATIELDYAFKNVLLQLAVGRLIDHAIQRIMTAFEERVQKEVPLGSKGEAVRT